MFSHSAVWRAIDRLARQKGWSLPVLAELAGLDKTALNPSKRFSRDGKARWPSLETMAKVLSAAEVSFSGFAALVEEGRAAEAEPEMVRQDLRK